MDNVDQQIEATIAACEELTKHAKILNSCRGVGPATTGILLAELPELGHLNRGQIAKLVGVAPLANDSGTKEGKRKTHAGRSMIRNVLYMSALVSTRYNERFKVFYESLYKKRQTKEGSISRSHEKTIDYPQHNDQKPRNLERFNLNRLTNRKTADGAVWVSLLYGFLLRAIRSGYSSFSQ